VAIDAKDLRHKSQVCVESRLFLPADQSLQQGEVLFIAVGREIEMAGNADKLFLFNRLSCCFINE
jgi:hypothetical protein